MKRSRWRRRRRWGKKRIRREERRERRKSEKEIHDRNWAPPQINDGQIGRCGRTAEKMARVVTTDFAFRTHGVRGARCLMFVSFKESRVA